MREYIKCALRNLGRKKLRTVLTVASIAIGVASVVLISTIGDVGKFAINNELNSLGLGSLSISVSKQRTDLALQQGDLEIIENMRQVESAIPIIVEYSSLSMRGLVANVAIWGIDEGANQIISLSPNYGNLFTRSDIASESNFCLVDSNTAKGFYGRENIVGKQMRILIGGSYEDFTVVGVVQSGGNAMQNLIGEYLPMFVYVPYTTMQRLLGRSSFDRIAVKVHDSAVVDQAAKDIVKGLEYANRTKGGYNAENIAQQKDNLNNLLSIVATILSSIAGISLVVAGLGIMTVMLVSVNERTREIGIKKSIGASRGIIMSEFLVEAFTISSIGSMIGVVVGVLLALIGCMLFHIEVLLNVRMILFTVTFAVVSGVICGVYPSWIASNLRPVDALRYE